VCGVCFETIASSIPRMPVDVTSPSTLAECKNQCLTNAACESVFFNGDLTCVLLGDEIEGQCTATYSRWVKTFSDCIGADTELTTNYVPDPCLASAMTMPYDLRLGKKLVCPNTPLDGEPTSRVYVARNGTLRYWEYIIQVDITAQIFRVPLYAATCAYYPRRKSYSVSNDCGCEPLPKDPSNTKSGAAQLMDSTADVCDPAYYFSSNKLWILAQPSETIPGTLNSFALSNGAWYLI
ncbi:hypothetical protein PRIPAC_80966, partial [Pristionchus pacificus]|uniref:Uncharacterized protein n=1 Tax=Pristionchus pacificus TaxID=54126 RepID=A0A2A6CKN7_PRIPA